MRLPFGRIPPGFLVLAMGLRCFHETPGSTSFLTDFHSGQQSRARIGQGDVPTDGRGVHVSHRSALACGRSRPPLPQSDSKVSNREDRTTSRQTVRLCPVAYHSQMIERRSMSGHASHFPGTPKDTQGPTQTSFKTAKVEQKWNK